jgi:peroxiredoxin
MVARTSQIVSRAASFFPICLEDGMSVQVGDKAPEFELPDGRGNTVALRDQLSGKAVILAFYPLAFTGG